jgi:hypothetical protein
MSLDNAVKHGKEHRKPWYRSARYDAGCRPNGGCDWCEGNRLYHVKMIRERAADDLKFDNPTRPEFWNDPQLSADVSAHTHMTDQEYDDYLAYKYGDDWSHGYYDVDDF